MATLTTLVDGQLAVVAPVNGNFAALNTDIVAARRTGYRLSMRRLRNVGTGDRHPAHVDDAGEHR